MGGSWECLEWSDGADTRRAGRDIVGRRRECKMRRNVFLDLMLGGFCVFGSVAQLGSTMGINRVSSGVEVRNAFFGGRAGNADPMADRVSERFASLGIARERERELAPLVHPPRSPSSSCGGSARRSCRSVG